jgi:hypothetical protein
MLLFDETNRAMELAPPPSVGVFVAYLLGLSAVAIALYVWRIRQVRV